MTDLWGNTDEERRARGWGPSTKPNDLAFRLLLDDKVSTPKVHKTGCYICEDPEFAAMGLPLCRKCPKCDGHIAADDTVCDDCEYDEMDDYAP